jgi:hypothetical protein
MVGQAKIVVAPLPCGFRHVLQAVAAIGFRRMGMQDAVQVVLDHQLGDERQVIRGTAIGARPVGIAALQLHALPQLAQGGGNSG